MVAPAPSPNPSMFSALLLPARLGISRGARVHIRPDGDVHMARRVARGRHVPATREARGQPCVSGTKAVGMRACRRSARL